ncbi:hypothetical protein FC48_GL000175 [Ligilactobacillus murinus DSM 20452 = NBRC 14221]|uniref:Uncharacterized protein n=1 Tax=Ligilactobacillus murinus DSM 20452 = NBRC 14221 TaxID=1423772 RepID=A0A0R2B8B7_9LACO|nr:hypothetical protein FC48_GL000175 [Ligilactobacillus murinus DSM 20452 = NBRC 14221]
MENAQTQAQPSEVVAKAATVNNTNVEIITYCFIRGKLLYLLIVLVNSTFKILKDLLLNDLFIII